MASVGEEVPKGQVDNVSYDRRVVKRYSVNQSTFDILPTNRENV